jgi:predicted metal-dependent phosphoesterase TrpH
VIDLHLHTTASDGKLAPAQLVGRAAAVGLRIISVTDHDTVAGLEEASAAAATAGIRLITGIEMTAVDGDRDVHVLGYFFDPDDRALGEFLRQQRVVRVNRIREIAAKLSALGYAVDVDAIVQAASTSAGRSVGRPLLADALVAAGQAVDRRDAFDRLLGRDAPAFVPRCGSPVADVIAVIRRAGGLASLAHPGLLGTDQRIADYAASGLAAIEVRHREHDDIAEARYRAVATALGLAVSGGSDFHEDATSSPGSVTLDAADFAMLEARAARSAPLRNS